MQWSADPQAGFTTGQAWQAPSSNFASFNVADQLTDEGSLLSHYKKWIQMRNAIGQLRTGEITMVNSSASSVFSFLRKASNEAQSYLVVHNLAQARNDLPISLGSSALAEGSYALFDVLSNTSIGQLNVGPNGAIQGTAEDIALEGYSSYLFRLDIE